MIASTVTDPAPPCARAGRPAPRSHTPDARPDRLGALVTLSLPALFILLWSTGYVAGKLALPHAGPFTLLAMRFGLAAVVLLAVSVATRAPWPRTARAWLHLGVVGLLMQVLHFSGVYCAIAWGLPTGVAALLIGMMPLATALGAHLWLAERMSTRQWLGMLGGAAGVALVIADRPLGGGAWAAYGAGLLGLAGLVAGTLYQKRFCAGMDLRTGSGIQMTISALAVLALALWREPGVPDWSLELIGSTLWLSLVNSIGAFSLMFVMIRRGQAAAVAKLFYLIPGVSALMGMGLLGEHHGGLALAGFALSAASVGLASMSRR